MTDTKQTASAYVVTRDGRAAYQIITGPFAPTVYYASDDPKRTIEIVTVTFYPADQFAQQIAVMSPTIHLNGTDGEALDLAIQTASDALDVAMGALEECAPNARDYYPQGDDAYQRAEREHLARLEKLGEVAGELVEIHNAILEQIEASSRQDRGRP